jgi:uncharacterized protein YjbI with pentapeptide repeats
VRGFVTAYAGVAGVVTAATAAAGLLLTYSRQRRLDREQRQNETEQRELDSRRHLDERFSAILSDLGDASEALQAAAAVSLLSFLRREHDAFHHQVRLVTLANLKVPHSDAVNKLLVRVLEAALRTCAPLDPIERDLSRAKLARANLAGLDLTEGDVAFADLTGADLTKAILYRARGFGALLEKARLCDGADLREARFHEVRAAGANFCDSNLRAAHMKKADLTGAQFNRARLQSAHFEEAVLTGAEFEQADLNDAYFKAATLDDRSLKSIKGALNWRKAHFSPEYEQRLEAV